jgi:hypothetical protein
MEDPFAPIWRAALPYLRTRKNDVHVPISYDYAERLLERHQHVNREIVLLSTILHDIGWAVVDQEAIMSKGLGSGMLQADVRIAHEKEGARLAREILAGHGYLAETIESVAAIVDGHDTRPDAISGEDELVKDADKLWRFTPTGVGVACDWFGLTPAAYADDLMARVFGQLFTDAAREMARADLEDTRRLLRLDLLADAPE